MLSKLHFLADFAEFFLFFFFIILYAVEKTEIFQKYCYRITPHIRPGPYNELKAPLGLITEGGPYNRFTRPGPYINQNFAFFGTWVGLISDIRPGPYMPGNTV